MAVEVQYIRDGKDVQEVKSGAWTDHQSKNRAKRWSREYQKANGGLGMGAVRVEKK